MRIVVRERGTASTGRRERQVLGIVGGGQLGRMMVEASVRLDVDVRVLAPSAHSSAASIASDVVVGDHDDIGAVRAFGRSCDVVTFEHESTPTPVLDALDEAGVVLRPSADAMRSGSDKARQRLVATEIGMAVAPHVIVSSPGELREAAGRLGLAVVAKVAHGGYDGRGVRWLRSSGDVEDLATQLASDRATWVIEPDLQIDTELAVQIVRRPGGEVVVYPVVETVQREGICTMVTAPAGCAVHLAEQLTSAARRLAERLDLVGTLAVEAFVVDGQLLLNELAPRPHNSGHYTIDACVTSQFENHVRSVLDLPLGDAALVVPAAVMANVIARGDELTPLAEVPVPSGTSIHLYGKQPKRGRKVGHVTTVGNAGHPLAKIARDTASALERPERCVGLRAADGEGRP